MADKLFDNPTARNFIPKTTERPKCNAKYILQTRDRERAYTDTIKRIVSYIRSSRHTTPRAIRMLARNDDFIKDEVYSVFLNLKWISKKGCHVSERTKKLLRFLIKTVQMQTGLTKKDAKFTLYKTYTLKTKNNLIDLIINYFVMPATVKL